MVSYQLVWRISPGKNDIRSGMRGRKNPGAPIMVEATARLSLNMARTRSGRGPLSRGVPVSQGARVTPSQKLRSAARRAPGRLPAIRAALIEPIEMPATQSGSCPARQSASYAPA